MKCSYHRLTAVKRLTVSWLHARVAGVGGRPNSPCPPPRGEAHHGRHGQPEEGPHAALPSRELRPGAAGAASHLPDPTGQAPGVRHGAWGWRLTTVAGDQPDAWRPLSDGRGRCRGTRD